MGDAGPLSSDVEETVTQWSETIDGRSRREVNVLVTGFGPFKSFPKNPSWLIASTLPKTLTVKSPKKTDATTPPSDSIDTSADDITINLHVYDSAVPVAYHTVRELIPPLLRPSESASADAVPSSNAQIVYDHVLHIGMAGGRNYYSLESLGHRDGYKIKDIESKDAYPFGEMIWKAEDFAGERGPAPEIIEFGYDERDVWGLWVEDVNGWNPTKQVEKDATTQYADRDANGNMDRPTQPAPVIYASASNTSPIPVTPATNEMAATKPRSDVDIRISHDAGRFLCDFIFFTSLAERWRQGDTMSKVIFLHVPGNTDEPSIDLGRRVTEGLLRSIVSSWESGERRKEGVKGMGPWTGRPWRA